MLIPNTAVVTGGSSPRLQPNHAIDYPATTQVNSGDPPCGTWRWL